jgi:hypothetical protein
MTDTGFVEVQPDPNFVRRGAELGSTNIRVLERKRRGVLVRVIASTDPSGPKGELEEHASVTTDQGKAREPTPGEVRDALRALGWERGTYHIMRHGGLVAHVYKIRKGGA